MPHIQNAAVLQRIATLPLATYQAGETVLTAGTKTGRLLILRQGAVTIEKEGTVICQGDGTRRRLRRALSVAKSAAYCRRANLGILRVSRRACRTARRRSRRTLVRCGNPGTASQPRKSSCR